MVKKLQGETFLLSANELRSGKVVFFTSKGWSSSSSEAIKIKVDEIENFEEIKFMIILIVKLRPSVNRQPGLSPGGLVEHNST